MALPGVQRNGWTNPKTHVFKTREDATRIAELLPSKASYNLNGDPRAALAVIACPAIASERFVSKNVCHGVHCDEALHAPSPRSRTAADHSS